MNWIDNPITHITNIKIPQIKLKFLKYPIRFWTICNYTLASFSLVQFSSSGIKSSTQFFITDYALSYISSSYFNISAVVPNEIWSRFIYRSLNLTDQGSLLQCMLLCFKEPNSMCTILVFQSPICFLGNSIVKDKFSTAVETVTLYANYGNFHREHLPLNLSGKLFSAIEAVN